MQNEQKLLLDQLESKSKKIGGVMALGKLNRKLENIPWPFVRKVTISRIMVKLAKDIMTNES